MCQIANRGASRQVGSSLGMSLSSPGYTVPSGPVTESGAMVAVPPGGWPSPMGRFYFAHLMQFCQCDVERVPIVERVPTSGRSLYVYETGRKIAENFKATMTILFDKLLPKWNYVAIPQ